MTKTKLMLAAGLAFATLIGVGSAQAATRQVTLGLDTFATRCMAEGGVLEATSPIVTCYMPTVQVDCAFAAHDEAECRWPGIASRPDVDRLIGMARMLLPSGNTSSLGSGGDQGNGGGGNGGGGGGINLPDLPFDNGNGGGGIKLPDLPINNK